MTASTELTAAAHDVTHAAVHAARYENMRDPGLAFDERQQALDYIDSAVRALANAKMSLIRAGAQGVGELRKAGL
jgi:hypothetical protein